MNILANFLPGVRDARTPFVTGVLCALIPWLWLGPSTLLPTDTDNELLLRLRSLTDHFGPVPKAILVSLSIYLAGSILSSLAIWLWNRANAGSTEMALKATRKRDEDTSNVSTEPPFRVRCDAWIFGVAKNSDEINAWLKSHVRAAVVRGASINGLLNSRILSGPIVDELQQALVRHDDNANDYMSEVSAEWGHEGADSVRSHYAEGLKESEISAISKALSEEVLVRELPTHLTRLQLEQETIWNEYDRLRSEHELRISLVPPTFGLFVVAVSYGHWPAAWSLAVPIALFLHGSRLGRRAEAKVWSALVTGAIESRSVQEVDQWDFRTNKGSASAAVP